MMSQTNSKAIHVILQKTIEEHIDERRERTVGLELTLQKGKYIKRSVKNESCCIC